MSLHIAHHARHREAHLLHWQTLSTISSQLLLLEGHLLSHHGLVHLLSLHLHLDLVLLHLLEHLHLVGVVGVVLVRGRLHHHGRRHTHHRHHPWHLLSLRSSHLFLGFFLDLLLLSLFCLFFLNLSKSFSFLLQEPLFLLFSDFFL